MRTNSHIRKDVKQSQPNDNEDYLQQRYREFAEITSTIKIVDDMNVQMRDSEELSKWKISSKIKCRTKSKGAQRVPWQELSNTFWNSLIWDENSKLKQKLLKHEGSIETMKMSEISDKNDVYTIFASLFFMPNYSFE